MTKLTLFKHMIMAMYRKANSNK